MRKGKYGVDAPYVPMMFLAMSLFWLILGTTFITKDDSWADWSFLYGMVPLILGLIYLHTTFRGKFNIWNNIFDHLSIQPDSEILDLGCGRGAVLLMAAKRLGDNGKAIGVDLWRSIDQSGNHENVTKHNAMLEGVVDKIELKTANMMDLPFNDNRFDVVTSNIAVHSIKEKKGREKALIEACRVLKKDGILVIADIRNSKEYVTVLNSIGMKNIRIKNGGWQGWWTGPWVPTKIVIAKK